MRRIADTWPIHHENAITVAETMVGPVRARVHPLRIRAVRVAIVGVGNCASALVQGVPAGKAGVFKGAVSLVDIEIVRRRIIRDNEINSAVIVQVGENGS